MAQLYFYYSAMNAGKSTSLLQSAHNYREQGMQVMLFTAAIDDRFGQGRISSRIGLDAEAHVFDGDTDFRAAMVAKHCEEPLACVLVDEAQFLTSAQVEQLAAIVDDMGIPVLCFGLRTDFQGQLFAGSSRLLAIADKLSELKTVCRCGRKATMTVRYGSDGQVVQAGAQVEVGGNERYESMCRRHWRATLAAGKSVFDQSGRAF
ncbi:MAG: thymidine kinase [Gammaproteobacteria bacterium]|nr:MAG: thymidine kinase [Gammaproteobacteria bacterium]PIE37058.1 MAG: thymidine kinase [Gammaproteobacteria bacterium]